MAVPWNSVNAAYLLRRAGFGPTAADVAEFTELGHQGAVARLVDYESVDNSALEARLAALAATFDQVVPEPDNFQNLLYWIDEWVLRMLVTARPLEEKMTLFWHGHFATSFEKVSQDDSMRRQIETLRAHAMSDFRQTLVAVSADPAMLIWLDNYLSVAADPNENYARELLELFGLGIGHYTEDDINEIARCFTGWTLQVDRRTGRISTLYVPGIHDFGAKAVLGVVIPANLSVQADGARVCEIVADHPACARFLATKLWTFFASGAVPPNVLSAMTAAYAANGHSVREMVRTMFLADEFYERAVTDAQIKSPTELIVGTLRTLGVDLDLFTEPRTFHFMRVLMVFHGLAMGQTLLLPPSVKGWDGGRKWVNTSTLLARYNYGTYLAADRQLGILDPAALVAASGQTTAEGLVDYFLALLGPLDVGTAARARLVGYMNANPDGTPGAFTLDAASVDRKVRGLVELILSTAEYQMNLKGHDPGLVAPAIVAPAVKKGKFVADVAGANIQQGAGLRVTGDTVVGTERFPLAKNGKGTKWTVGKRAVSAPGGFGFAELVPAGTRVTLVVENPDGGQSQPVELTV
jgi:uncharacterized protein (DUF1800 family)